MSKYRIITFDGGGIRGALTANLVKRLQEEVPDLLQSTAFFAGTSTGSFIALGLAYGLSPQDMVALYSEKNGKYIFSPKHLEVFRPKYGNEHLKAVLESMFPEDLKLRDLQRRVLVTSFRVTGNGTGNWGPVFYNNFPGSTTADKRVIDVALASSAAPVYFPSYQNHIDGGVIANNPSTAAIALSRDEQLANRLMDDIYLLSIGTGYSSQQITADTTQWGAFEWALHTAPQFPLLSVLTDGGVQADHYYSSQLLKEQYYRLNPVLTKPVSLDDSKAIPYLVNLAKSYDLGPTVQWIRQHWF